MSAAPHIDESEPCNSCGKSHPEVAFVLKKDGTRVRRKCKTCINLANRARPGYREKHNEDNRRWSEDNREKRNAGSRRYYQNNKNAHMGRVVSWQSRNKLKVKQLQSKYSYMRNYGLTVEDLDAMWNEQRGLCGICSKNIPNPAVEDIVRGVHVDHDHDTNEVRGLLCPKCNSAIGLLYENVESMLSAIDWVQRTKKTLRLII